MRNKKEYSLLGTLSCGQIVAGGNDTVCYVGPTICNETGNGPNSSLAATSLIVID